MVQIVLCFGVEVVCCLLPYTYIELSSGNRVGTCWEKAAHTDYGVFSLYLLVPGCLFSFMSIFGEEISF